MLWIRCSKLICSWQNFLSLTTGIISRFFTTVISSLGMNMPSLTTDWGITNFLLVIVSNFCVLELKVFLLIGMSKVNGTRIGGYRCWRGGESGIIVVDVA